MARISKEYEVRYSEIVETAMSLFQEIGYENTSVNRIIDEVGISKGTFYYYFKSKRELMVAVIEDIITNIMGVAIPVINESKLNAIEKMNLMFKTVGEYKLQHKEKLVFFSSIIYEEKNAYLLRELNRKLLLFWKNEFSKIIIQGNKEGNFHVEDPEMTAVMIFAAGEGLAIQAQTEVKGHCIDGFSPEDMFRTYKSYESMIERTLGAPEASIQLVDRELLRTFMGKGE